MKKVLSLLVVASMLLVLVPVAVAAPLAQQVCAQDYVVQKDDWLSKLADKYLGSVLAYQAIADATNAKNKEDSSYAKVDDVNLIEPGWKLCIPEAAAPAAKGVKVLLSMKGPGAGNPFWAAVEKGATETAAAMGVDLTVLAPPAETDVATQINQIEDQITKGVQAIAVAPTDVTGLNPTFEKAKAAGIPVLFVDTKGEWADALTFIGTDNAAGGKLAGEYICKKLGGKGKVAIITGVMSQQTHIDRVGGARDAMKACGLEIVAEQPADSERAKGMSVMENILTANPDVNAVFASNDNMALGAMEAIKGAGKTGIVVVGFDANPDAVESIKKGELAASVAQSPYNMGKFGVENAVKAVMGEKVEPRIDTGTELVSAESLAGAAAPAGKVKVLLSMKGPGAGNPFWAAVEKGATETAAAMGVDLAVLAPPAETDVATQINQVEDQITKGVQVICVAPTDVTGLNPTFEKAKAAKIPVLFVDTKGEWADALTFIGTDNAAGGKLAGEYICKKLGGKGKVAIITGVMSQQTHIDRVGGARDAMKACGLEIVAEQPADSERAKGMSVMENILTANPDVNAVFASNDNMALGAMEALKAAGKKDVVVVGFDANPDAVESIKMGELAASVAQSPYNMGKFCVENALKAAKGEKVEPRIDTGTELVSAESLGVTPAAAPAPTEAPAAPAGVPAGCAPEAGKGVLMVVNYAEKEATFDIAGQTQKVPGIDTAPGGGKACFQLAPGKQSYSASLADGSTAHGEVEIKAGVILELSLAR